jgi:hypothetical protein
MYEFHKNSRKKRGLPAIIASAENGGKGTNFVWKVHRRCSVGEFEIFQFSALNFQFIRTFAPQFFEDEHF